MVSVASGSTKMADSGMPWACAARAITRASTNRCAPRPRRESAAAPRPAGTRALPRSRGPAEPAWGCRRVGRRAEHDDGVKAGERGVRGGRNLAGDRCPGQQKQNGRNRRIWPSGLASQSACAGYKRSGRRRLTSAGLLCEVKRISSILHCNAEDGGVAGGANCRSNNQPRSAGESQDEKTNSFNGLRWRGAISVGEQLLVGQSRGSPW
jgi:hypothetical protein